MIYERQDSIGQAAEQYERVLTIEPGNMKAQEQLEKIRNRSAAGAEE